MKKQSYAENFWTTFALRFSIPIFILSETEHPRTVLGNKHHNCLWIWTLAKKKLIFTVFRAFRVGMESKQFSASGNGCVLSQLPDAESVCGGHHGQLRLPDSGLFHSRRPPPWRIHQGGQRELFIEAQVMQIHRANPSVINVYLQTVHYWVIEQTPLR